MATRRFGSLNDAKVYVDESVSDELYNKDGVNYYIFDKNPDPSGYLYLVLIDEDNEDRFVSNVGGFPIDACDQGDMETLSQFGVGGWSLDDEDEDDRPPPIVY